MTPWIALLEVALKSSILVLFAWFVAALWRPPVAIARFLWVCVSYALAAIACLGAASLVKWQAPVKLSVPVSSQVAALHSVPAAPGSADYSHWLPVLWMFGTVLLLTVVIVAQLRLQSILKNCSEAAASQELLDSLSKTAGVKRPWRLLTSASSSPFTCGTLVPTIVVPSDWQSWPESHQNSVLLHELSHVRGADVSAQNAALLICCLQWFNPFAWLALSQLRRACEAAADEAVLHTGVRAPDYAEALLAMATMSHPRVRAVSLPFGYRPLARRIDAVLNHAAPEKKATRHHAYAVGLSLAIATLFLGGMRVEAQTIETVPSLQQNRSREWKEGYRIGQSYASERKANSLRKDESFESQGNPMLSADERREIEIAAIARNGPR